MASIPPGKYTWKFANGNTIVVLVDAKADWYRYACSGRFPVAPKIEEELREEPFDEEAELLEEDF